MISGSKSIQEMAVEFANTIYKQLNQSVTSTAGVDVLWFRAIPNKTNQDVIFQTYTLYGVEDCPLEFKALYSDTNYDDAALTYNIMGISYAIPMTLEIDTLTWETVTGNDGSIPQQYDVVFIPMTQKLLEVASMSPIKKIGGQLAGYKINLTAYKPKRSRIVGENLKDSIEENSVNRDSLFGTDIENAIKDIVDDNQLGLNTSTPVDEYKDVEESLSSESGVKEVRSIIRYDLIVDGHTVSRNHYDMSTDTEIIVQYNVSDTFTNKESRTFSCWFKLDDNNFSQTIKNIKEPLQVISEKQNTYISAKIGTKFKKGDNVLIQRGLIKIPGVVVGSNKIHVNSEHIKKISKINAEWYNTPGFAVIKDQVVCLFKSEGLSFTIKGGCFVSIKTDKKEQLIQLHNDIVTNEWLGIMINLSKTLSIDLFGSINGLKNIDSITGLKNDLFTEITYINPYIPNGQSRITNIRMCSGIYNDMDSKILEFITYNVKNNSKYIINDDAMTYLNKTYMGKQR